MYGTSAKTVAVIRHNAEQKARDEAEAKARQDQTAAEQRRADMIRLADQFEGAVGEIVDTVSSASTELEASATTLTSTAERSQQLDEFRERIYGSLDLQTVAYEIANDGSQFIDCDRLSVAVTHSKKCKIEAVSGSDVVEKRSNLIQLMRALVDAIEYKLAKDEK